MSNYWKEKIKLFILIGLVITSIIQVGIIWSPAFFPISSDNFKKIDMDAADKLFMPYRVSASDGLGSHWIIRQSDPDYMALWEDARYYLSKVMENAPNQTFDQSQWPDIFKRRSLVFELKSDIDINLAAWFLNTQAVSASGPQGVYKLLISPLDNINYNYTTVYILDSTKVYRYDIQNKKLSKKFYDSIISSYQNNSHISSYGMIGNEGSIKPDILGITDGIKEKQFNDIVCSIPKTLKGKVSYDSSELLELAKNVLGDDVYSYNRYEDPDDNTVKFISSANNMYKIYFDGVMEFTSLQSNGLGSKGKAEDAFKSAFRFISNCKLLSHDTSIYLSGMKSENDRYIFYFNYIEDEYPIFIDYQPAVSSTAYRDAITIEANENSVLNCNWVLRDFKKTKDANFYNISLRSLLSNDQQKIFRTFRKSNTAMVTDIIPSYVVTSNKSTQKLSPIWVINTTAKNVYTNLEKVNGVK